MSECATVESGDGGTTDEEPARLILSEALGRRCFLRSVIQGQCGMWMRSSMCGSGQQVWVGMLPGLEKPDLMIPSEYGIRFIVDLLEKCSIIL